MGARVKLAHARTRLHALGGTVASAAGKTMRTAPGLVGAALLCFGLGQIYHPLWCVSAGLALVLVDRRVP